VRATDININPFNKLNPMSIKDAAAIATVGAFITMALTNIANVTLGQVRADVIQVVFDMAKTYIITWASIFGTETGIATLVKKGEEPP